MANFHGIETIRKVIGGNTVTIVKSAVIMLIGIAPKGDTNTLKLVLNDTDASQFGRELDNFDIPQALSALLKNGAAPIIVNNVYSTGTNNLAVAAESKVVTNRKIKTTYHPTTAVVITDSTAATTYVKDTDYSIDDFGNVTILSSAIANGATLKASYSRFDATTFTSTQIIGGVSGDVRTGLSLFDECKVQFGFSGRILIAPNFSSLAAVATAMVTYVDQPKRRAIALIDAPAGTSKATALAGRGSAGTINFKTQSKRAYLLFPNVKDYYNSAAYADANGNASVRNSPIAAYAAGVISATDNTEGYHYSPSNHLIPGVIGTTISITDDINDPNSDAAILNGAGIATVSTADGSKLWGNRNASFPINSSIDSFLSVVRTADIIEEAIETATKPFIDKPINQALIDDIRETINSFFRALIGRGVIIDGVCTFDRAKNPDTEMAAGRLQFDYNFLPPPPAEQITYNSFIDVRLFAKLG